MTVLLRDLPLFLDHDEADLAPTAAAALGVDLCELAVCSIVKKSLDARRRREPGFLYSLVLELDSAVEADLLGRESPPVETYVAAPRVRVPAIRPGRGGSHTRWSAPRSDADHRR